MRVPIPSDSQPQGAPEAAVSRAQPKPGLILFDMDSTLIAQETIDELARLCGPETFAAVKKITHDAMAGTTPLTFSESLIARLALLKGLHRDEAWRELLGDGKTSGVFRFTKGVPETVRFLARKGWKTGVVSGGFKEGVEWVQKNLGLDYAFANELMYEDGKLAGKVVDEAHILDGAKKKSLLLEIADTEGIVIADTVAVGDGSNDVPMILTAGFGVAFNAKPKVQQQAPHVLNSETMIDLLYMLGYTKEDVTNVA